MKTFTLITISLPLFVAGANLHPRQTAKETAACPSLWSAVLTSAPPLPTAVQEFRSSLSARMTDICMSFGDPDMPDPVQTAISRFQDTYSSYLASGQPASVYSLCSDWLDKPIVLTDASQIASSKSRMSAYQSCQENGKISSWWFSTPATRSSAKTTQSGSPANTAAVTGGSASSPGQSAATSSPKPGAASRGSPAVDMSAAVTVVFGAFVILI